MTKLIFSFDTEDYINPHAVDGIIRASKIIREAGFTPCHNVVAWCAEALEKWGRQDAIDEIKKCELSTHSLKHTYHPTICEYTDIESYDEAMQLFRNEEDECIATLKRIFGDKKISAACPPGASCSYVAHYGYADMGIPVYDGGLTIDEVKNRPVSFCNIMVLNYNNSFDDFGLIEKDKITALIEKMAENEIWIFYHHPAKNTITEFADVQNFNGKNYEGEPILADMRTDREIEKFEENLKFFLKKIKNDDRFEVVNYKDIAKEYTEERIVKPHHIPDIKKALDEDFFPVTLPISLSLSDIMLACRDFLLGKSEHICGKVYGFMDAPYAVSQPVKLTKDELIASCDAIRDGEFLPTKLRVGEKEIGPADWLRAALTALSVKDPYSDLPADWLMQAGVAVRGEDTVTVVPDKWQIDLDEFPLLRDQNFRGTWRHSPALEDRYLSDRARLQSWTIRLPMASKRRIF